jgi:hypothetical protein
VSEIKRSPPTHPSQITSSDGHAARPQRQAQRCVNSTSFAITIEGFITLVTGRFLSECCLVDNAASLIGGFLYLHETSAQGAHFGGRVVAIRECPHTTRSRAASERDLGSSAASVWNQAREMGWLHPPRRQSPARPAPTTLVIKHEKAMYQTRIIRASFLLCHARNSARYMSEKGPSTMDLLIYSGEAESLTVRRSKTLKAMVHSAETTGQARQEPRF